MTIRRGDILWADLGMFPTTSVQGGVRPVIVVSNNKANTYSSVITVVPMTSRIYKKTFFRGSMFFYQRPAHICNLIHKRCCRQFAMFHLFQHGFPFCS